MKIVQNAFKGIMPKLAIDKLPEFMAQIANDSKTASGDLVPYRRSTTDLQLAGATYKSFFEYLEGGNTNWVYYDLVVHWVRSPTAGDLFERTYLTGADAVNGKYKAFVNDIQLAGDFDFTTDFYFPGAPSATALVADGYATALLYRSYFYTYVSRYGEEGPPSALTTLPDYKLDEPVDLNGFVEPSDADEHLKKVIGGKAPAIRIYRTATDIAGVADFLLVEEIAVDNVGPNSTAWASYEYVDTVAGADLGAVNTSTYYDRCPDDLTNLRGHPGGFFVASKDNTLYFSEPYSPWAWPEDYQIPIDQEIVGIGVYGSTIVVATDGNIYTFSGPHPTSLYKTRLNFEPCLSQRALVETNDGVLFPSLSGFQHVTAGGVINITKDIFKPEDWNDYYLSSMHGTWYNGAYYGFYNSTNEGHIIIDITNGSVTTGVDYHLAGYVAIADGRFHTIFPSDIATPSVQYISTWDGSDTEYRSFSFKSKQHIFPKPVNFKVAQVILDKKFYDTLIQTLIEENTLQDLNDTAWDVGDDLGATFNGASCNKYSANGDTLFDFKSLGIQEYVNFKIFVDGALKWTKQVTDSNMFKLPRGFRDKKWEWSVDGMIPVKRVTLATSTEEIV
jgi:hypothetical protein